MSRFGEYLKTTGTEHRLVFARGAVLVFFSQLGYMLTLMLLGFVFRWALAHHQTIVTEGRATIVLVLALTMLTMVAQLGGLWLLAHAVRPWETHSIPAVLTSLLALANLGLLTLVMYFIAHNSMQFKLK